MAGAAELVFCVAQICNLLYRRIAFCGASTLQRASEGRGSNWQGARTFGRSADCKSAIRQITNLRYEGALCAKHIVSRSPAWRRLVARKGSAPPTSECRPDVILFHHR